MADKRIQDLNALQDKLYARLQAVESRIRALEDSGAAVSPKGKPLLDKKTRIDQAAWELEDAIFDRALPKDDEDAKVSRYPEDVSKARDHHVELLKANNAYYKAIVALVILTFVEVPPWCHAKHDNLMHWTFQSGDEWCPLPKVPGRDANPNLSGIPYLPPGYSFIAEICIESVILYKFWREYTLDRDHFKPQNSSMRSSYSWCGWIFAIGSILDTMIFMQFRVPFRFTWVFRTGLIFLVPGVQHMFFAIFNPRVLTEFGSVAVFFLGTMVFFAWIGLTVFKEANVFSYMEGEEKVFANKGFTTFADSMNTMFVGGVTGEFIDCFLPSFNAFRISGAVWMIYLLLTQVLFKNLVMDTLISAYLKGKEQEEDALVEAQVEGMCVAFNLLSEDGEVISRDDFMQFVKVLRGSPRWKPMESDVAALLYSHFDEINKKNFVHVVSLLQSEFWITKRDGCLNLSKKDDANSKWLEAYVWEKPPEEAGGAPGLSDFDGVMNYVLIANLVMVLVESFYDINDMEEPEILDYIEIIFSFLYVGEVSVKLAVKSWGEYTASFANQFDFFTTWLLLCTSVLKYLPISSLKANLSRYANILRLLRLLRILKQLKRLTQVQFMIKVISRIVMCAGEVLELMGTFFFLFCNLAVNLFGGLLYEGNEALEESEYAEKHWYILNFNDMFMAFMAWFVQILCEYVPNYADALRRTATAAGYSYGFYSGCIVGLFYITTAAIMYELLLAFTVDVFMSVNQEENDIEDEEVSEEREQEKEEKEEKEEHEGEDDSDSEFDASEFLTHMEDEVFSKNEQVVHVWMTGGKAFQKELKEKYDTIIKGKGLSEPGAEEKEIVKAAWIFENGVFHQQIVDPEKVAKLKELREQKEELSEKTDDPEAQERFEAIIGEIGTLETEMDTFPKDVIKARADHCEVLKAIKWWNTAIVGLVVLTLTEVPAWCHENKAAHLSAWTWAPGVDWCRAPNEHADMNLSGIWYLPPAYALIVEIIVELTILYRFFLEYKLEADHFMPLGGFTYTNIQGAGTQMNIKVGVVCAIGSIIDTAIFAAFRMPFRLTFVFRTGLLCLIPGVQRLAGRIFTREMLGQFVSVAIFFVGTVLFFAWIAVTIYKDSYAVAFILGEEEVHVNKGFEGLRPAIYTMFLAGMTEGFDDIFIPTVTDCRIAGVLWLVFLLLTQVLFLNLVIDAFVAAYLEGSETHQTVTAHAQALAVYHASRLLFGDSEMEEGVFMSFIAEINRSPRMREIKPDVARAIYNQFIIDYEKINKESFCDVCSLVQNDIWVTHKDSILKDIAPGVWNSDWFKKNIYDNVWETKVREKKELAFDEEEKPKKEGEEVEEEDEYEIITQASFFDEIMDTVLLFNLIFIVVQSSSAAKYIPGWMHLSTFFTLIYVIEVGIKLSVKSWRTYWAAPSNQFDFATTWILFGTWILKYAPIQALQQDLMHYANILRLLRLLRVVKKLKKYKGVQFMVGTVVKMLELASDILMLLSVCLFIFTTFSVNFFGGLLYEGNPALEGSDYEEKHWYVFNFNDVIMGFTTWFTQLLCEYAPEWADALARVSSYGYISWYIYPIFYIFGVAIVFEILKAFTIETYLALKEEADAEEGEEEEEEDEEEERAMRRAAFDEFNGAVAVIDAELQKEATPRCLHFKHSLLPDLLAQIKDAYAERLEEEEKEAEKEGGD